MVVGAASRDGWRDVGRAVRRMAAAALAATATAALAAPAGAQSLIRDTEIERTIGFLSQPIFEVAGLSRDNVLTLIVNDQSINAFVTGRTMVLHTGLLSTLETPEQVMGVIAHEAGHITGGHQVRRIAAIEKAQRASILGLVLGIGAAVAGGGQAGVGATSAGQSIIERSLLKFTRGQEASADQAGLLYLDQANVDPIGMVEVLEMLAQTQLAFLGEVDPYMLTHPLSQERIRLLQAGVAASPARGARLSDDIYYWHARMRAKLAGFLGRLGAVGEESFGSEELDLYRDAIRLHRAPDPNRAVAAVDRLIAIRPNDPFYHELKGQILSESGRGPEAVAPYRRALELLDGRAPLIASSLGAALLTVNTPAANQEALTVLETAAAAERFDGRLRRSLAIAYERTGAPGMAALVVAERLLLEGRVEDARSQAARAKELLPRGSSGWIRAEDVLAARPPE